MKKLIVLTTIVTMFCSAVFAQSDVDVLRYSFISPTGNTARGMALGGAVGALGADPSTVQSNPAGLAQYKSGSFNITLGSISLKNESQYLAGNAQTNNLFKPVLPGINVVTTNRKMNNGQLAKTGWINTNFSFGWNKVADFNRNMNYSGTNTQNSFTDYVASYTNGLSASSLQSNAEQEQQGYYYFENMFWQAYLIDSISDGNYYAYYDNDFTKMTQSGEIITKGGMNEFNASFAANYENKVYFGFGLNVNRVRYSEQNTFAERDNPVTTNNWNSYNFTRNLETRGAGFGGRIGVIFRPNNNIRVGATIHTPTVLSLTDNYYDELYVLNDDKSTHDLKTIDKEFSYSVTTPMKYGFQAAYIFEKQGFLSAEIESIDYSTMSLSADNNLFSATNQVIANKYSNTINLKLGGEYAYESFRFRAGYAHMGNPIKNSDAFANNRVSIGMGVQERDWAFDFGVIKTITEDSYVPYKVPGASANAVSSNTNGTMLVLTLTSKF
jgi:hypothetical protein